jgi:phage gpG-like protein
MSLIVKDGISPRLARMARNITDKRSVLEVMAISLQSWTVQAFSTPGMRPAAWPAKADGSASTLEKTTALRQSLGRRPTITATHAYVGSDRAYAAVHQFGSRRPDGPGGGIPARPYFPFAPSGKLMLDAHLEIEEAAVAEAKHQLGLRG